MLEVKDGVLELVSLWVVFCLGMILLWLSKVIDILYGVGFDVCCVECGLVWFVVGLFEVGVFDYDVVMGVLCDVMI